MLHFFPWQAHGKILAVQLIGANQAVFPVQKGRSTQTRHTILLNAEDVEFVMENKVSALKSSRKRPIVILHVEPFMIQFEIGNYFGAMLAHRKENMELSGVRQEQVLS